MTTLTTAEIETKVRDAIGRSQKRTIDEDCLADLHLDSLEKIEASIEIEDEFGFHIPDSDLDNFTNGTSVADWVAVVRAKLVEAGA